ncbi:MAG: hypothetical protein P4M11_04630 [Candidatus Pacebacteria bacterium]|nr:hypothetical protein [Candidatus Paceibacterota bacterium]
MDYLLYCNAYDEQRKSSVIVKAENEYAHDYYDLCNRDYLHPVILSLGIRYPPESQSSSDHHTSVLPVHIPFRKLLQGRRPRRGVLQHSHSYRGSRVLHAPHRPYPANSNNLTAKESDGSNCCCSA